MNEMLNDVLLCRTIREEKVQYYKVYNNGIINILFYSDHADILKEINLYLCAHLESNFLQSQRTWIITARRNKEEYLGAMSRMKSEERTYRHIEYSGTLTVRNENRYTCDLTCDPERTSIFQFVQDIYCAIRRISMRSLGKFINLHASACRVMGKTILILGDKGSGKSFLTDFLLLAHGAEYIAADQVIIYENGQGLMCRGNITSYRVWKENNYFFGKYEEYRRLFQYSRDMIEWDARVINGKINVPPKAVANIMHRTLLVQSKPDILLFITSNSEDMGLRLLSGTEVEVLLKRNTLCDAYKDYELNENARKKSRKSEEMLIKSMKEECYCLGTGRVDISVVENKLRDIMWAIERGYSEKNRN